MKIEFAPVTEKLELIVNIIKSIKSGVKHIVVDMPRQTGKTTISELLNQMLELDGFKPYLLKFEEYRKKGMPNLRGKTYNILILDDTKSEADYINESTLKSVVEFKTSNAPIFEDKIYEWNPNSIKVNNRSINISQC